MLDLESSPLPATQGQHPLTQCLFQMLARDAGLISPPQLSLRERFGDTLPMKPYAADHLPGRLRIEPRASALRRRHIQLNHPSTVSWLVQDIDSREACIAHRDSNLPPPTFIAINPVNGHAHSAYLLATPVLRHSAARLEPLRYLAAIERGITRRLGADPRYAGLIAKNPLHQDWRVEWRREEPYALDELQSWLFARDMAPVASAANAIGLGRNCEIFDALRSLAYGEVLAFKQQDAMEAFRCRLEQRAALINTNFSQPLHFKELRCIARSVARWTWKHFSEGGLQKWRSVRGRQAARRRWRNHLSMESAKPWVAQGISRATWYRRRRKLQGGSLQPQIIKEETDHEHL
jgi:hypothetical protein